MSNVLCLKRFKTTENCTNVKKAGDIIMFNNMPETALISMALNNLIITYGIDKVNRCFKTKLSQTEAA